MIKKRNLWIIPTVLFGISLILAACDTAKVRMPIKPKPAPTGIAVTRIIGQIPDMIRREDPLTCAPIPVNPTQADSGADVYCRVCMVCHGDVGQGLDAWRAGLEPPDNNCFEAKCHGPRHPRDGFVIPEYAPVIMGAGILDHYGNAASLHKSMVETMPWWNPGYLTEEEYWQITAFLLRANGIDTSNIVLDENNAEAVIIQTR